MSAAEALAAARAAGIQISIDGDDLVLQASAPPSAEVLDLLARHKAAIVTLLRPGSDGWSAADWQEFFDERAGIGEFDGGLPRDSGASTSVFLLRGRMAAPRLHAAVGPADLRSGIRACG